VSRAGDKLWSNHETGASLVPEAKRGTLHPAFGDAITAVFERARKGRGILSLVLPARNDRAYVSSIIETHDPRRVSALVDRIRFETETAWHKCFAPRSVWTPHESIGLVRTVLSIDAGAAYPLMTTWSGHVREAAIRRVASVSGPFSLAMLVHRLNDWVEQVRKAAEAKLAALEGSIAPATIVGCVEMLLEFERVGRAGPTAQQLVANLMRSAPVTAMLRDEVLTGKTDRAFRIFQRQLRTPALDGTLMTLATVSPHPRIRACATRVILKRSYHWRGTAGQQERAVVVEADRELLARAALADRATGVRLAGLEYVVSNGRNWLDRESILLDHAAHPRNALAELAQYGLGAAGIDWVDCLRNRLVEGGKPSRHVARIIGKQGDAMDGARLWGIASALLDDRAIPFLSASAQLKNDAARERLSSITLRAADLRLARRAARALDEVGAYLTAEDLKPAADRGDEFFARGLDRHFKRLGVMKQISILARLERAGAKFDLDFWFSLPRRKINRGALIITDEDKKELELLLTAAPEIRERARRHLAIAV
jgi:hypothetical protein